MPNKWHQNSFFVKRKALTVVRTLANRGFVSYLHAIVVHNNFIDEIVYEHLRLKFQRCFVKRLYLGFGKGVYGFAFLYQQSFVYFFEFAF